MSVILEPGTSRTPTVIEHDFQFHFLNGTQDFVTAREGRDEMNVGPKVIRLMIAHEDGIVEYVEVNRSALASFKRARREVNTEAEQVKALEAGDGVSG